MEKITKLEQDHEWGLSAIREECKRHIAELNEKHHQELADLQAVFEEELSQKHDNCTKEVGKLEQKLEKLSTLRE